MAKITIDLQCEVEGRWLRRKFPDLQFFVLVLMLAISRDHSCNCTAWAIVCLQSTAHCTCLVFLLQRGWQGFLYTRCHNTNRKPTASASSEPKQSGPGLSFRSISIAPLARLKKTSSLLRETKTCCCGRLRARSPTRNLS